MYLWERVITFLLREKRYGDESRMIALYPSHESLLNILEYRENLKDMHDFSGMRELGPEEIHATIRWWKHAEGGNDKRIIKNLEKLKLHEAVGQILSIDTLGDSLSFMLESESMQNIFSMVDDIVRSCGAPRSDYPSYKPHVALFYDESFRDGVGPDNAPSVDFPIVFDRLDFVNNNDDILLSVKMEPDYY